MPLWLWLMVWLAETHPGYASTCDLGPCTCTQGKVHCNCTGSSMQEIVFKNRLKVDYLTTFISVSNCNHIHLASRVLSDLPSLRQISVTNIANLTLEEQAFSWTTGDNRHPGLTIDISQSTIPEIPSYTFRGSLRDILLTEVNVFRTEPFAFAAIDHADKMVFTKVQFSVISPQTFKKFSTNFLIFIDSYIDLLPSRTMVNVEVYKEVRLENIKVNSIKSRAIHLQGVNNVKLVKSSIDYLEHNALRIVVKGDVSINDNLFHFLERDAFLGITVDDRYLKDAGKQDLVFENNSLTQAEGAALTFNTTGFDVRLDWIRLNQSCSCEKADSWSNDLVIFYSNLNTTLLVPTPHINELIYCLDHKPTRVIDYQKQNCDVYKSSSLLIKIVLIVGVISILLTMGTVVYCVIKKKGKRYINDPFPVKCSLKPAKSNKDHILVVPEGKTYRETELHVIVENVEPIVSTEYVEQGTDMLSE